MINYLVYEDDKDFVGSMFLEIGKSLPLIPEGDAQSMFNVENDTIDHCLIICWKVVP